MPDLTNCPRCGRLIDDKEESLCNTCTDRAMDQYEQTLAEREIAAMAQLGGIDHSDYLARMGIDEGPTDDELAEEAYETALLNAANDESLPFDGPVEDDDYPSESATPRASFGLTQDQEAELQVFIDQAEIAYKRGNDQAMEEAEDAIFAYVNNHLQLRDTENELLKARVAELEAQVKTLEGQIGLFPATVYNAYLDAQNPRLSQVPYAMACMSLKDAMSRAILNRPTGYPIVPTGEA